MTDPIAQLCQMIAEFLRNDPGLDQAELVKRVEEAIAADPELAAALQTHHRMQQQNNRDGAKGFQISAEDGSTIFIEGTHYHLSEEELNAVLETVLHKQQNPVVQTFDFKPYLQFVRQDSRYQNVRALYTETEALIPLEAETAERKSAHPEPDSDQARAPDSEQTQKKDSKQAQKKGERFPVLEGLRKYALGSEQQHVLLAGQPGSGKSTTLKRLLLEMVDEELAAPTTIPVYVQLKSDRTITDMILAEFRRAKVRITPEQLDDWLLQDQLVLLLDGVNEIPSDKRRRQLQDFREDNPTTPMIFTTRGLGNLGIEKRLEMRPLSESQMREFVGKYLSKRGIPDHADTLLRQLRDRLREIAETPLLLKMLCDVFDPATQQIPKSKGELFQQFDQDYERIKKDIQPVSVSEDFWEFKADILQFLAFSMLQTDDAKSVEAWYTLPRDRAETLLENWLNNRGVSDSPTKAKLWLKDLCRCHLLQDAKEPGDIEFHHQLFQEYYAAEYLLQRLPDLLKDKSTFKQDYLNLLKWTESIALMLSLITDRDQALKVVKLALDINFRLGARLAGEAALAFHEAIVGKIIALSVADWVKVELLGETHSEVALPKLLYFLTHPDIDIAKTAASYLGETHNQDAVDILIRRLDEISDKFFSQKSWGGSDKTGKLWSTHVQALSYLSPQATTQFLREKLDKHGTLLLLTTQAAPILMQLDAERFIPELLEEFRNAQNEENRKIASGWEEPTEEIQIPDSTNLAMKMDAATREAFRNTKITPPSSEWRRRNHILNLLENSSDYGLFIPALIQVFEQEPDEMLRKQIIQLLGSSNHDAAISSLIQKLSENSSNLRAEAVKQLIKLKNIDNPHHLEALSQLAENDDWSTSWNATRVLGNLKDSAALPRMIYELENHQLPSIRSTAAQTLGIIGNQKCIPSLLKAINHDSDKYVRLNVACALSCFGQKEAIPILIDALGTPTNFDIRAEIIKGISRFGIKEPLRGIIRSGQPCWQRAAIELTKLEKSQKETGSTTLLDLFNVLVEPGHKSSSETIDLLSELADSKTLSCLVDALENPEKYTRDIYFSNRVALVLGRCRPEMMADKLPALMDLYNRYYIQQLSWVIPTIQSRCKFYNYEIFYDLIPQGKTISIYFSYSSEDESLQIQLADHLILLERQGIITSWSKRQILPGDDRAQVINQQLNTADIILLLISSDAMTQCHDEIQRAIEQYHAGEARVIPVLLRPVDWAGAPFSQLPMLPKNCQPVTTWANSDEAFQEIAEDIRAIALEIRKERE
ncbi:HEAT repeat domain-containing protein [Vacuolonema iberomarrocanum]|uniref:HEAT repeat domain-containing protein n=1 Tax=Vacuolonema iberomarrocanum TaxID=3454632 RepID=UPI001A0F13FC|nr:HEAT repeat domain-containing protein [filamentous cyanobacterium LEGE 07170]